jgi:KipI family sensor histidine kinase inhibitor
MRLLDAGEAALSVEFGDSVDPAINARVLALDAALRAAAPDGVLETVPTYRALMIHYEPMTLSREALAAIVERLAASGVAAESEGALWTLPCCYEPPYAEDIGALAEALGLSAARVASLHAGATYQAYMYGFAPGWLYLGGLPVELAAPRRSTPRGPTPQGAVLIGGGLSLVATRPMPTGWYVVGRTPERLFALEREPPFLIAPGDRIRFEPVDAATFDVLEQRAQRGDLLARRHP